MKPNDALKRDRRGFLQAAAATFAFGALPFAARAAGEHTPEQIRKIAASLK